MNKIVGIRYIGKKDFAEDTVTKSGARWLPRQVHNFASKLAERLLQHTDSFEVAPVDPDGDTFMGAANGGQKMQEPVTWVNLNAMDRNAMLLFSRREFNHVFNDDGMTDDQVRTEVHRIMAHGAVEDYADMRTVAAGKDGVPFTIMVSQAEHAALMAGELVYKLIPAEVADLGADETVIEPGKDEPPTLDELLNHLDKDGLLALAAQEGVEGLNRRHGEDTLREKLREALTSKAE